MSNLRTLNWCKLDIEDKNFIIGFCQEKIAFLSFGESALADLLSFSKKYKVVLNEKNDLIYLSTKILESYFKNELKLAIEDFYFFGTDFQLNVWKTAFDIPWGKTTTYWEISKKINNPNAVRAVGSALGKNNILLLIPCHRVISKNGSINFRLGANIKTGLINQEKNKINHS
ncbi:6-O-methylguanine-DNA methyltransferase [Spiroplasma sabaudiense Ar-1343]|uniref:6-O-methylguanine-DNA methyltransferase n=1 Tax=Spiroplasma sabaudiense Ar-1343 TaxID=1276257 RepID=W6A8W3_9MOLU|nr:methylated-DNA--[protein]-cysteine S-methyltransferase [Spiroplasma sabaudiense]AHI53593.1 6-O-methylguanine-DNA methyltransferase [Spiroplasma sabaudiense Ar-1343]